MLLNVIIFSCGGLINGLTLMCLDKLIHSTVLLSKFGGRSLFMLNCYSWHQISDQADIVYLTIHKVPLYESPCLSN